MKKRLLSVLMGTVLVMGLAACGGGSDTSKDKGGDQAGAEKIASQKCTSCHGNNLEGSVGPSLQKIGSKYSKDQILNIIKKGKNNGKMPAGLISGDDAEKVAEWLAAKK